MHFSGQSDVQILLSIFKWKLSIFGQPAPEGQPGDRINPSSITNILSAA